MHSLSPITDHVAGALPADGPQADPKWLEWAAAHAQVLLLTVDAHGQVLSATENVRPMLGFAPDELIGGSVFAHIHPLDLRTVQKCCVRPRYPIVVRHRHKDGSWRWLEAWLQQPAADPMGENRLLVVRDITVQKHLEEDRDRLQLELNRISKLAALGTIAGGVVHDFNNLLTAIMAYTSHARGEPISPVVAESLDQVLKASERARQLTRQILAFSRQESHVPKPADLAPIVQEALALLRPVVPANVELVTHLAEDSGLVLADACQIHQVVVNLCGNALDALRPRAGCVTVGLRRVTADEWMAEARPRLERIDAVNLSVADDGQGMDEETCRRMFEPFFTTKPPGQGTGLGLAVVQRIVRDHNAAIRVQSTPGRGTTINVYFPLLKSARRRATSDGAAP